MTVSVFVSKAKAAHRRIQPAVASRQRAHTVQGAAAVFDADLAEGNLGSLLLGGLRFLGRRHGFRGQTPESPSDRGAPHTEASLTISIFSYFPLNISSGRTCPAVKSRV